MTEISSEEFIALSKMLPEQRFDYAIEKMIEYKHLWGLFGENGWLMLKADDDACIPVWPHEEFASAWVKDDFPNCQPKQIEFYEWLEQWLPGMKNNKTLVLVFPLGEEEEGIMLEAQEMLDCIAEDMQNLPD
jgi:hypothetical protein